MNASNLAELREQIRDCIDIREQIDLLIDFAFERAKNRPQEGIEALEEGRKLALAIDDRDRYAKCLITTAICLEALSRYDESLLYARQAEEEYRQLNNLLGLARCANTIGLNHQYSSRYPEAIEKFTQVIEMARETPNPKLLAAALNNLGGVYYLLSHYHKALEYFLEALRIYEEENHAQNKAILTENISSIYFHLNDHELAFDYLIRALGMVEEMNDPYSLAHLLTNLANHHKLKGEIDKARDALRRALNIFTEIGAPKYEGITRIRLALMDEYEEEKKEEVLSEIRQGLQSLYEVGAMNDYVDGITDLARVYLNHNRPESTVEILTGELPVIEEYGGELLRSKAYELLAKAYEQAGNLSESIAYMKRHGELQLNMMGEERGRLVAEMQARYDVSSAEREREIYRMRAAETEKLAEERSKQLSVMAMQLVQKNNLLKEISENLERLGEQLAAPGNGTKGTKKPTRRMKEENAPERKISAIQSLIGDNLRSREDWARFEEIYNLVHNDFTQQIAARAPDLSPMELKVCALLHINLSNKEIADILYISVRTVESHRYRIRRKLGLSSSDNLASVITPASSPS